MSRSGIHRIDFVTPYLSSDDGLPLAEIIPSHDPHGILQAILAQSQGKFYTEDNKVEYLKMSMDENVQSYVIKSKLGLLHS